MASDDVGLSPVPFYDNPEYKRHPNNTKTDQLPISEVITGLGSWGTGRPRSWSASSVRAVEHFISEALHSGSELLSALSDGTYVSCCVRQNRRGKFARVFLVHFFFAIRYQVPGILYLLPSILQLSYLRAENYNTLIKINGCPCNTDPTKKKNYRTAVEDRFSERLVEKVVVAHVPMGHTQINQKNYPIGGSSGVISGSR